MPGASNDLNQTKPKTADETGKITCHLVSLPKVLLHRIDDNTIKSYTKQSPSLKKPLKRLTSKPSKFLPEKSEIGKNSENKKVKSLKNLKKENNFALKSPKAQKKIVISVGKSLPKGSPKVIGKLSKSPVKNMLNKTMLQKKSRITLSQTNRFKPILKKPTPSKKKSAAPVKVQKKSSTPKTKIDAQPTKDPSDSGEEFLYDELIDQIKSTDDKKNEIQTSTPKTTNIILKQNEGNKPPTVVKGGIIKKTILPADLKPVISPNRLKYTKDIVVSAPNETRKSTSTRKNIKPPRKSLSPVPAKKASPWPIAISSPLKDPAQVHQNNTNKKIGPKSKTSSNTGKIAPKLPQKNAKLNVPSTPTPNIPSVQSTNMPTSIDVDVNAISFTTGKHKMGPKKTATVIPQQKSQDDNLSDEYTEEERLENIDSDPVDITKIINNPSKIVKPAVQNISNEKISVKQHNPTYDSNKDDEDPHLDLLRILTDESEEPVKVQSSPATQNGKKTTTNPSPIPEVNKNNYFTINEETNNDDSMDSSTVAPTNETSSNCDVEPPPRTIYDLMNEISLQYPSWNLHILPESNAFCIAQVTKGRLGLPTLKKCIELDPTDYNAKVYIHQYHIKRFDGIYDSEESIIALIEEINSIKA